MLQDEQPLSEKESLELITKMINKAKCDYQETGIASLVWGSAVTLCGLVSFIGYKIDVPRLDLIWFILIIAVVIQVIISMRVRRRKKYRPYDDDVIGGILTTNAITISLFCYYANNTFTVPHPYTIFLIAYGIPTFTIGFVKKFKPMIIGGIVCWALAIACIYTPFPYDDLYNAPAALLAWFVPGLILRRRYLKAKRGNV